MSETKSMRPSGGCQARRLLLLCCLWGALSSPVRAEYEPAWSVQGFGTLGMARTTSDDVEFVRDLSQQRGIGKDWSGKIDSVVGIQANWRLRPEIETVVQATSRYRHDRSFTPEIAWAYVKYDPTPSLSLRAGRLGTEFFMQADSRWVGYSFLTVRPVGDYFWYLPFYSIHGGDAALTVPVGESIVRGKIFYGHSRGKIPLADQQWDIAGSPMLGASVEFQRGAWHLRASYANIRFEQDLPISPVLQSAIGRGLTPLEADYLAIRDTRTHYYALGAVYDRGPWQVQLQLNHIEQGSNALENSDGGYVLAGYRVGELTPYLGYSWICSQIRGNPPTPVAAYVMSDAHSDQRTGFAGMRWDVMRNVALKAQWDAIRGNSSSLLPYRMDDRARWDGKMDVFSLTLDFIF